MAATLNYVPHVGAMLCMVVLFFVGAVSHQSLGYGAGVAGVFMLLTAAESYFITPMVLSKSLQLSPLAVILAILFGGWMWGIAGGLMAAPVLTIVKLVCDQFESLHPVAAFLSGGGSTNGNGAEPAAAS
jgi:predicted PurR-regulated permease PerM